MSNKFIASSIENGTGTISLNRPEVSNALNRAMVQEITEQLEAFDRDPSVKVIVIRGNDRVFAAGADIEEMMDDSPLTLERLDPFAVWDRMMHIRKPMIASVNGYALGGGFELALHCDLIVAAEGARFGFPEVNLGVMPGAGGTQYLTKLAGKTKALEWIWLGEHIDAREAEKYGIVNKVVAPELIEEQTSQVTEKLARQAPIALNLIKEAVNCAADGKLEDGLKLERKNFYLTFDSYDQSEGMKAFQEKRPPSFKGE